MSDIRNSANWSFETKQLHIGQEQADPVTDARAVPIYATTSYVFHDSQHAADRFGLRDPGNIYGRLTNPTQSVFEARIAALENGTAALAVASGAAAIAYAFQALAKTGEHIVASKTIYGGTYNLLAHTLPLSSGITTTFVDPDVAGSFEAAIQENTKAIFIETWATPTATSSTLRPSQKSPTPMASRWWWTPPSPRPTWSGPSTTAQTLSSIPPPSLSAATARPSAA